MPITIRLSRSLLPVMAILLFLGGCSRHPTARYLYGSNCGICHHGGQGMAGSVPPLIGRIDRIATTPEGRAYLAAVLMNGLSGRIKANGSPYNAEMPLFRYLKDDQAATILTWLSEQGGTKPAPKIMPEDVAYARAHRIGASGVANLRDKLSHTQGMP